MQRPVAQLESSLRYRQIVTVLFAIGVIASGVGTVFLGVDYVQVYDTMNRFIPQVSELEKANITDTARRITVYIFAENRGSRTIQIIGYTITLFLNEQYVSSLTFFPQFLIEPGTSETFSVSLDVTGGFAEVIHLAEETGQWNWEIRYPMRVSISWLYMIPQYWTNWEGITEVSLVNDL